MKRGEGGRTVFLKFSVVIAACSILKVCAGTIAVSSRSLKVGGQVERDKEGAQEGRELELTCC